MQTLSKCSRRCWGLFQPNISQETFMRILRKRNFWSIKHWKSFGNFSTESNDAQASPAKGQLVLDSNNSKQKFTIWPTVPPFYSKSKDLMLEGVRVVLYDSGAFVSDKIYESVQLDGQIFNRQKSLQVILDKMRATSGEKTIGKSFEQNF